ncbi:uncharacterized protein LOC128677260 isoform X3 [Plodia interpunctella]|uniref:uncharacterized protein LOC128677260 isoform X3 n=1 Tax=Plodia interpunctella TaxID=58824 RepID=UPI0023689A27|nr:uncharacterized protein LOC128677260 isoform X3 [Plodia interpunctella]
MSLKRCSSGKMVAKNKSKVIPCSTPEQLNSPSRDSDSVCDSDAASPVPFLCTQDGAEGETDVVWNFYTPKSEHTVSSRFKNSTPLSRKAKKPAKHKLMEKQLPKRRPIRHSQKKTELFQELLELNQNLHELISKKSEKCTSENFTSSNNDEDIFNESLESPKDSPKSGIKSNSRCLRRNVLSSKFAKPDPEAALESDDSMNECLLKASQAVENILENEPSAPKRVCYDTRSKFNSGNNKPDFSFKINEDSIDAIMNCIKIESPVVSKIKKAESLCMNNDSFDNLVGNLNDSVIDQLTQMPIRNEINRSNHPQNSDWKVQEVIVHDGSPSNAFGRHNSMPESPVINSNKPSTSGMAFGRHNSMPYGNKIARCTDPGDSPIRCSPDQIERKRQQAREKLFAKRLLPFTSSQNSKQLSQPQQSQAAPRKALFQPRIPSAAVQKISQPTQLPDLNRNQQKSNGPVDIKLLIEKKRQEALMKLRRRQPQSK